MSEADLGVFLIDRARTRKFHPAQCNGRFCSDRPRAHEEIAFAVDGAEAALFDLQQLVSDAGGLAAVPEIGGQYLQWLLLSQCRIAPEEAFELPPRRRSWGARSGWNRRRGGNGRRSSAS